MKKECLVKILTLVFVILFVNVTVSSNYNINKIKSIKAADLSIKLDRIKNSVIEMKIVKTQAKPILGQIKKSFDAPLAVPVLSGYHPAVASDGFGNVVLTLEYNSSIMFASSQDGGNTWPDGQSMFFVDPAELPDVDSCGDGRFLGGFVPDQSELYMIEITGPLPDGVEEEVLSFEGVIKSVAVAGYTDENYPEMFGSCAIVSDLGVPIYFYGAFYNGEYHIFQVDFYPTIIGCEIAANDIDLATLYAYGVWNINNSETGEMDIMVIRWDFGIWEQNGDYKMHPQIGSYLIKKAGNDDYIDVSAYNNNVVIVSERDGDVVAYYSTNGMTTVYESTISIDAQNPRIIHNGNNTATCTFIKNNSAYYSRTRDGGATWSSPKRIDEPENNHVPEEYKASDVCDYGVAWMNSDDGFVYFADIGSPPNLSNIDGPNHGKPGVEYTYCINLLDLDNDSLFVLWDWNDGTNSGWLGPYDSEEVCASHIWNKKGTYNLSVTVKDQYGASATAYMEVIIPRTRTSYSNLFFRFLEQLLLLHRLLQI